MKRRDFLKISTAALAARLAGEDALAQKEQQLVKTITSAGIHPMKLRCEYRIDPLGIDAARPLLGWILESVESGERGQGQSAYCILAATTLARLNAHDGDLWKTGKVNSGQSLHIPYGGRTLNSGQPVWWKVKVWDQDGNYSPWSSPAKWSMGLLRDLYAYALQQRRSLYGGVLPRGPR